MGGQAEASPLPRESYRWLRPSGAVARIDVVDEAVLPGEPHALVLCHEGLWLGPEDSIPLDAVLNARAGNLGGRLSLRVVHLDREGRVSERGFVPSGSPESAAQFWCRLSGLLEERTPNAQVQSHVRRLYERRCEQCGHLHADSARFMRVLSFVVMTHHNVYESRLCRGCTTRRGLSELFKSVTLGWWGPMGVLTFGAIWVNLSTLLNKSSLHPVVSACLLPLLLSFPLMVGGGFVAGRFSRWVRPGEEARPARRAAAAEPGERAAHMAARGGRRGGD